MPLKGAEPSAKLGAFFKLMTDHKDQSEVMKPTVLIVMKYHTESRQPAAGMAETHIFQSYHSIQEEFLPWSQSLATDGLCWSA